MWNAMFVKTTRYSDKANMEYTVKTGIFVYSTGCGQAVNQTTFGCLLTIRFTK